MLRILRRPEVITATGLSGTRIDELERERRFPARRRLSQRAAGWLSNEIEDWITSRPLACEHPPDDGGNPRGRGVGKVRRSGKTEVDTAPKDGEAA